MKKDDLVSLAHLLSAMKEESIKLEGAMNDKDLEKVNLIKKELLEFQRQIDQIL